MDESAFGKLAAEAVAHLYDHPYLQTHALGRLLAPDPAAELRGQMLQRRILDAIQSLRPSSENAASEHAWRIYRYLVLRYIQAGSWREAAHDLMISERQAGRVYREAMDALASVLWDEYLLITQSRPDSPMSASGEREAHGGRIPPKTEVLDQEVSHLAAAGRGRITYLCEVLDGLRSLVAPLAEQHDCQWAIDPVAAHVTVAIDRTIIRQILLNLCGLICDGRCRQLRISAATDDERVLIALAVTLIPGKQDAGPILGLTDSDPRLGVSRRLIEAAAGTLALRDSSGNAMLLVSLPAARKPRVLLVDDNPDVLALFSRFLKTAGFDVLTATNGPDGIRLAQQSHPAAITLDVMMASQDGWETLQVLKNHPTTQSVPVLICSVLRETQLARYLGAAELLPKPVTRTDLLAGLARCGLSGPAGSRRSDS